MYENRVKRMTDFYKYVGIFLFIMRMRNFVRKWSRKIQNTFSRLFPFSGIYVPLPILGISFQSGYYSYNLVAVCMILYSFSGHF